MAWLEKLHHPEDYLKMFLKIRDENQLFDPIRQRGQIGIPCIQREDASITFEWDEFIK